MIPTPVVNRKLASRSRTVRVTENYPSNYKCSSFPQKSQSPFRRSTRRLSALCRMATIFLKGNKQPRALGGDYAAELYEVAGKRKNCEAYAFQLVAKPRGASPTALLLLRDRRRRSAVRFPWRRARRIMIFREVDRKNENSSRCLGPLCRGYAEARYEPLPRRVTEESVKVPHARGLRHILAVALLWTFYGVVLPDVVYHGIAISATRRSPRDTIRVCVRRRDESLLLWQRRRSELPFEIHKEWPQVGKNG